MSQAASRLTAIRQQLRTHWIFAILVTVGAVMRLLTMISYPPALLFPDSWGYIATAYSGVLPTIHPIGYPLLLHLFTLPDRSLAELVAFQHLGGLGIGVAVYAALIRSRLPRLAAAAAAALVLLDGYSITLEQYVMSDTFFTVLMLAAVLVVVWPRLGDSAASGASGVVRWLVAGGLLAAAALVRELAPVTIPLFLVYGVWTRAGWRPLIGFIVAAAVPLLAYSALVNHRYHVFNMTATPGWFLYGRVGGFADCTGIKLEPAAQKLCETPAQRASHPDATDWYVWGPSPARRIFDPAREPVSAVASTNAVLESFSRSMIRHHPLDFVGVTLRDFAHYFTPDVTGYNSDVSAISLPRSPQQEATAPDTQRRDLPGLRPTVRAPAGFVRSYRSVFHVPRAVLALLALIAVLAVLLRVPARREVFLLAGTALLVLLATAASAGFSLRYLMPAVPLLAIGGALAAAQLSVRFPHRRKQNRERQAPTASPAGSSGL
jgi:Dolichyl-phosphate-mannose-protein mannosyltransferase